MERIRGENPHKNEAFAASEEIQAISDAMNKANEYALEYEVIWSALKAMKEDPTISIERAMEVGCAEWDV